MPKKPTSFNDIIGHKNLVSFLQSHLEKGTLPQFILFEGDEGLGKSSIAKILALSITGNDPVVKQRVIMENRSTENVLLYNMSVNGGKDTAKEVESNLGLGLSGYDKKVIILDEAHAMSEAAQDVFLVSTEYLPKGVYLFMCTTDSLNIKPTLKSRALTLHLNHLSNSEMVQLLTECVRDRNLKLQAESATIHMIAAWAEGKPRVALNLIEGFGKDKSVSSEMVKEFIDYLSVEDVLPLLTCLASSMTQGLHYISEMRLNKSFIPVLVEVLKVKQGMSSFRLSMTDTHNVRRSLVNVPADALVKFIYLAAAQPRLTRAGLISAFLQAHVDSAILASPPTREETLNSEMAQKLSAPGQGSIDKERPAAPSMDELLKKGAVFT